MSAGQTDRSSRDPRGKTRPDGGVPSEVPGDPLDDDCGGAGVACIVGTRDSFAGWIWPSPGWATLAVKAAREPVESMRMIVTCIH